VAVRFGIWALLAVVALAFHASSALAAPPPEVARVIHAAKPYGAGSLGLLFVKAYKASLWTDADTWSMDVPFALSITYDMHFSTTEMIERGNKEMKHVDPSLTDQELAAYDRKLIPALPAVGPGDRITVLNTPGEPAQFYWNGALTAVIDDPKMNADFLGIWLSPQSSAHALRASLTRTR
jgi:hypothetical protein